MKIGTSWARGSPGIFLSKTQMDILVLRTKIAVRALQVVKAAGMLPRYQSCRLLQLLRTAEAWG